MKKLKNLHRLNKQELTQIANNLVLTKHAKSQLNKRLMVDKDIMSDFGYLQQLIVESNLAYVNTDTAINIAFSEHTYLVVSQDSLPKYVAITYKEPSHNKYTIKQKYELALKGVER